VTCPRTRFINSTARSLARQRPARRGLLCRRAASRSALRGCVTRTATRSVTIAQPMNRRRAAGSGARRWLSPDEFESQSRLACSAKASATLVTAPPLSGRRRAGLSTTRGRATAPGIHTPVTAWHSRGSDTPQMWRILTDKLGANDVRLFRPRRGLERPFSGSALVVSRPLPHTVRCRVRSMTPLGAGSNHYRGFETLPRTSAMPERCRNVTKTSSARQAPAPWAGNSKLADPQTNSAHSLPR
jgi:hypothetical protein